jgi:hypothetical protein
MASQWLIRIKPRYWPIGFPRWLGRTVTILCYAHTYLFSVCIFYVNCVLLTIWNIIFRHGYLRTPNPSPYWVTAGQESRMSWAPYKVAGSVSCCHEYHTSLSIFMILSLYCVECWECWSSICRDVRWQCWYSMLLFEQGLEQWGRLRPSRFLVSHARIC